jgi:hypothetical protein
MGERFLDRDKKGHAAAIAWAARAAFDFSPVFQRRGTDEMD